MLVITSDLHLSDGSLGPTVPATAMELFAGRLNELALAASFRAGGHYQPIEQIELVLLGDVLDLIRSAKWLSTDARPWDDPHSPAVFDAVSRITAGVLHHNEPALAVLRQLAAPNVAGTLRVPSAGHGTRSVPATIPVRIHYMVGDNDWPLHLPGQQFDRLRARVVECMGLANRADQPFPHDPAEGGPLLEVLRRHRVLARHGDIYDPIHFDEDRNTSSLGDALSIELFARFQLEMRRFDGELSEATRAGLAALDDVRPILLAPLWIDNVLERTMCNSAAIRSYIRRIWDRLVDRFLESTAVRLRDAWNPLDLVDCLAKSLKFRRPARSGTRHSGGEALSDCFRGDSDPSEACRRHAQLEEGFRNRSVRHVVYGHTHQTDFAPLEASLPHGQSPHGFYFNAGTWRREVSLARCPTAESERTPNDSLTFLAFYEHDERGGLPFETWTGSWGGELLGQANHRIDSSHAPLFHSCRRICNTTLSDSVPGSG